MSTGFSIYDALHPYVGQASMRLTRAEFSVLMLRVLEQLQQAGSGRILARLESEVPLNLAGGIYFAADSEKRAPLGAGWRTHRLAANDAMLDDRFIVSDDEGLPIVLVARRSGDGFNIILSIDEPLIEIARVVLAQYHGGAYIPITPRQSSFTAAGRLIGTLARQYTPSLVSSWASRALSSSETLEALQQAIGAVWIRWNNQTRGTFPPTLTGIRANGTYQHERVTLAGEQVFEAVGSVGDGEFVSRCHICAGLLSVQTKSEPSVRQANLNFSFDLFNETFTPEAPSATNGDDKLADIFNAWPDLDAKKNGDSLEAALEQQFPELKDWLTKQPSPPPPSAPPALDGWPPEVAETLGVPDVPSVNVPTVGADLLRYVNREISYLRDRILDVGMFPGLSPKPREMLDQFVHRSGDLLLLLDEVVYMQKMVEQVRDNIERLEPHNLLGSLVITFAGEAERRGVELDYDAPDELPEFMGAAEAMNRALVIMLERAVNAAAPRGRVEVGARPSEPASLEFFIRDTGSPISEEDRLKLFQPNFLHEDGVTGLGFAALQLIAEAHRGEVRLDREKSMNVTVLRVPLAPSKQ